MPDARAVNPVISNDLAANVFRELEWDPHVDALAMTITAAEGVVTIAGIVADASSRAYATGSAMRARGVRTLDNQLSVAAGKTLNHANTQLAHRVEHALSLSDIKRGKLRADVSDLVVTLSGTVDWEYEAEAALHCVQAVAGAHSVVHSVTLQRRPTQDVTVGLIRKALKHSPDLEADVVHVSIRENEVTLTGIVQSEAESRDAEGAAWLSPHVVRVYNELTIRPL